LSLFNLIIYGGPSCGTHTTVVEDMYPFDVDLDPLKLLYGTTLVNYS